MHLLNSHKLNGVFQSKNLQIGHGCIVTGRFYLRVVPKARTQKEREGKTNGNFYI